MEPDEQVSLIARNPVTARTLLLWAYDVLRSVELYGGWDDDFYDEAVRAKEAIGEFLWPSKRSQGDVGPSEATSERSKGATQGFAAGGKAGPPGMEK